MSLSHNWEEPCRHYIGTIEQNAQTENAIGGFIAIVPTLQAGAAGVFVYEYSILRRLKSETLHFVLLLN